MDVYKAFLNIAKKRPDKIAIIHKDRELRFSEVEKDIGTLISTFKEMGMKRGEKLAVKIYPYLRS